MPNRQAPPNKDELGTIQSISGAARPSYADTKTSMRDKFLEGIFVGRIADNFLTKRETEILRLIMNGKTNKQIARFIYRTERTVEFHRNRLMHKLNAHNAADLVRQAITLNLV